MNDGLYEFIVGMIDMLLWGGELIGEENLPRGGPAVFIANHLDATGPIAAVCSIPLCMHPWVIGDMMDKDLAPAWLKGDFTEWQLHLQPLLSEWVARLLCHLVVPLFYSIGCIPVYRDDYERMQVTLQMSMEVLRQGQFLLVFPEDNRLSVDPLTLMQPFQHSFARLGEMYYEETGDRLEFYPIAIHGSGVMRVGKAVTFNPINPVGRERRRLKILLEDTIKMMYLHASGDETTGAMTAESN